MRRFFHFFYDNIKSQLILYIFSILAYCAMPLTLLWRTDVTKNILDNVFSAGNHGLLPRLLLFLILAQVIRTLLHYTVRLYHHNVSQTMLQNQREKLYATIQAQDMNFFKSSSTGELMSRLSGDLDLARYFISDFIPSGAECIVSFLSTFIYLCFINLPLTLCLTACTPFFFLCARLIAKAVRPLYRAIREKSADLNKVVQENIEGNRVVKAYAQEIYEVQKFDDQNDTLMDMQIKTNKKALKYSTPFDFFGTLMSAIALVGGGFLAVKGQITVGELSAFISLTFTLSNPLRVWGTLISDWQRITTSVDRVLPIYDAKPMIVSPKHPYKPENIIGDITFDHVTLDLEGTRILDDVSFQIHKGETVAIMGPTGSGKTFIINLILRLYDVTSGSVLVDGVDVREYDLATLRHFIGVSTQDVFLFSETIEENICYGIPELPMQNIIAAAQHAQAYDFINHTESGFDTIIGERGVGLSGGQKQRLALARALAIRAPILILDDTTSALDMETEHEIQLCLKEYYADVTQLIVAQRISSVRSADRIIIMDKGKVVQIGEHNHLIQTSGYYRDIYCLQCGGDSDGQK